MSLTIVIGGTTISPSSYTTVSIIDDGQVNISDSLAQVSTATFTIHDTAGTLHFSALQQVTITDSVLGQRFTGYVTDSTETNIPPNKNITHLVNCMDQRWLAIKRVSQKDYTNQYAGDIFVDQLANYQANEGVTASYAQQSATTNSDFATGLLSGVVPSLNVGDGNLELSPAGSTISKVESVSADWQANSSSVSLDTTGKNLCIASHAALQFVGTAGLNWGNPYVYQEFWTGGYVVQANDYLTYNVWVNSGSPQIKCGVDCVCTDGTTLRDSGSVDQNGLSAHPSQDLSNLANDQWYYRVVNINALAGKTIAYMTISFQGTAQGTYTAYVYDVIVFASNQVTKNLVVYSSPGVYTTGVTLPANNRISDNGYSNVSLTAVVAYEKTGTRVSLGTNCTNGGIAKNSLISWTPGGLIGSVTQPAGAIPPNTSLVVNTSIDAGATWQAATNFATIPALLPGSSLIGRIMGTQIILSITGKDPTVSPALNDVTWTMAPSYAATKNDVLKSFYTQAHFNTGTKTNVTSLSGGGIQITGFQRDWNNALFPNQTAFGSGSPVQSILKQAFQLQTNAATQANSRLDFVGTWTGDFTQSIDIPVPGPTLSAGMTWGTTVWTGSNPDGTYAYKAEINTTTVLLGRGTNGGASSQTLLGGSPKTFPVALVSGDVHTLTVNRTGNVHTVYVDGVQYIQATDSTYGDGIPAISLYNSGGVTHVQQYDNYGIMTPTGIIPATPIPKWVSPSISLGSITVENSIIEWNATQPSGTTVIVSASVNGGAYAACTNGAVIPGLTAGTVLTSGTLQLQVQLQSPNAAIGPILTGLSAWVLSAYNSTGNRISPALNLSNVGRAGSTLVNWNAIIPNANTTMFVDTSLDKINWTNVGSGATGSAPVAGISGQPDPIEDTFISNTSGFYTSTFQTGGTPAAYTWHTANFRLEVSGGTTAQLLYSGLSDDDVDLVTDMDTSDAGGLCWRVVNSSNFYDLVVCDASSPTPGVVTLSRVVNNVRATIATGSVTWVRGTPHRIRVTMLGAVIVATFDGTSVLTYTDNHPLGAGQCGLRTDTVSGASAAQFYFFRVQIQGDSVQNTTVFTRQRLISTDPTVTPQLEDITVSVRSPAIQTGAFIPSTTYSVLNGSTNTVATNFDDLAKQSNYWWRYDMNKAASFQAHNGTLAPFCLTNNDMLLAWPITVKNSGDLYRNTPWILGGTDTVFSQEPFKTDGITSTFTVKYPVDTVVSIIAGAKSYTFGVKGVDAGKDFYYQLGNNTFNQDVSETPIQPGLTLTISYNGQVNVVANVVDSDEIKAQAQVDGTSGIVEVPETAPGLGRAAATQLASSRDIQYKAKSKTLICTTARTGLAVGQMLSVFLSQHQLTAVQMLITDMQTSYREDSMRGSTDATPYFTITAVSGPLLNSWSTTLAGMGR
jgi:hypothetical protein